MTARHLAVGLLLVAAGATAPAATAAAERVRAPTRSEAWVARVIAPARAFAHPRPSAVVARLAVFARWAGGPNQLLVLRARTDRRGRRWLRVRLPQRPNDAAGWVLQDRTVVTRTRWRLDIDVGARRVRVLHAGRVVRSFPAVVGASATPTPRGRFAVSEIVRQADPGAFLGPWALHLTAHSNVLDDFGGGPGTVAVHGRAGASLLDPLGTAASHGCIRIDNAPIGFLARKLVPGAPVTVHG